jgi:hypothetical protein
MIYKLVRGLSVCHNAYVEYAKNVKHEPRVTSRDVQSLESVLLEGLIVDRKWLSKKGFHRTRVDFFLRSGRLVNVSRGVYRRPGPPLKWEHVVYSLRTLGFPVHIGGRSALEMQGYAHYLPLGANPQRIDLRCTRKLPYWLDKLDVPAQFDVHTIRLFAALPPDSLTTRPFGHWDWPLRYATPELALLQVLADVRNEADFSVSDKYFESATLLRPSLVNALLRACTQIKAKRLFLWFAARHDHPWHEKLELDGVDLGRGKRMIVAGGALDTRFQITVPKEMASASRPSLF